ncbi:MAG: GHMP family kinase ATP-binding protein [Desulfitobacteriaceae bacterium]
MVGTGWARCPGTCGEWVQGAKFGVPFLVDCPIDRYSEAIVEITAPGWEIPSGKEKVGRALTLLCSENGIPQEGKVSFVTELPIGKGMASSTADIVAAAAALWAAHGVSPESEALARLALRIEPSDSVMFPGITEISHVQGSYYKFLGPTVPAKFLALDWGGEVDTLHFNARQDLAGHYRRHEQEIRRALALVKKGIEEVDLERMVSGGMLSARCNLEINPKPFFAEFQSWVLRNSGFGVITAHSGTLLAGVFSPQTDLRELQWDAQERFMPVYIDMFSARDGGVEFAARGKEERRKKSQ